MPRTQKKRRGLRASFNLGNLSAESDPLLEQSYFDNGQYELLESKEQKLCFLIGRTGAGKSAAFLKLEHDHPGSVIKIDPEQLSLPYVLNVNVVKKLSELEVHMEPFFRALWEHIIIVEVLKHKFNIDSQQKQDNIVDWLKKIFTRDPSKMRAVEYLEEFGDKFWEPIDSRVKDITSKLDERVGGYDLSGRVGIGSVGVEARLADNSETSDILEERTQLRDRFQNVVNETQLPKLKEMIRILGNEILAKEKDFVYVLIDDLDKEWVDDELSNLLIRCLFEAVIDLQSVQNLRVIVALRTNILTQLEFHKQRHGRQEEKIRGLTIHLKWNEHQLIEMLDQRFIAASERGQIELGTTLERFLPHSNSNKRLGNPVDFMLSRTLTRPRDAIDFANEIVQTAVGKALPVKWDDLISAERAYSSNRLSALVDEWKDPFLGIEKVLRGFRNSSPHLTVTQMITCLDEITLECLTGSSDSSQWLLDMANRRWNGVADSKVNLWDCYETLVNLLYEISFIGITTRNDFASSIYSNTLSVRELDRDKVKGFVIHPAFRTVLNVDPIKAR